MKKTEEYRSTEEVSSSGTPVAAQIEQAKTDTEQRHLHVSYYISVLISWLGEILCAVLMLIARVSHLMTLKLIHG